MISRIISAFALGISLAYPLSAQVTLSVPPEPDSSQELLRDITALLQTALQEAKGGVHIPAGVYDLTSTIEIPLNEVGPTVILGQGNVTFRMRGPGPAFRFIGTHTGTAAPSSFKPEIWTRERTPLVRGIEIVGHHPEADGIEAKGTMQLTIQQVVVRKSRYAIHLVERNRNFQMSDCHLYENHGIGVFYDGVNLHQSNIVGCHISYNDGGGIVIRGGDVRNVQITGCDIEANMGPAGAPATANILLENKGGSIGEVAITGCTIQHRHDSDDSANIRIDGESEPIRYTDERRRGNITITGNVMSDVGINLHLRNSRAVTVVGNTLWQGYIHDCLIENCESLVFANNVFDRSPTYFYSDAVDAKLGMVVRGCRSCIFTGNLFNGVGDLTAAVDISDCRGIRFDQTLFRGFPQKALRLTRVSHSSVSGTLIESENREPIEQVECTDVRIESTQISPP